MGWFSGQSKAAKELERKRQQEKDEENAKRADDVCDEQKTPYQKKVDKPPNVLRVTVIRAKELPAVDKKMFSKGPASADPFPCMSVEGNQEKGSVKKKNLTPVWLERFELPCEDPDSVFSFEVMDHDNFGAADFMGGCKIKLATLKDERAHRNWYKLGNVEGEQDEHERGEVELCLRWCHDKSRAYDLPKEFKAVEKAGSKAMPNELHVYLVRARDLEAMDSGLLGKASSDPIVVLDVMGTAHKSQQKKKELNPVWLESFSWPVEDDEAVLEVVVEDYDLTGNDFMGRTSIPLKTLSDRKIHRQWHRLLPPKLKKGQKRSSKDAGKKRGRIDLAARWVHNPKLVVPLPPELQASELHFDRPANEVQIFLVRAAGLPIMDRNLMSKGGSSDPVVTFSCCGEVAKSSIKKKDLNPQWAEYHSLLVEEDDAQLLIVVEDYDLMGLDQRPETSRRRRITGVPRRQRLHGPIGHRREVPRR